MMSPPGKRHGPIRSDEDVDILSTPQIQSCTSYPLRGAAQKMAEEPPTAALADPEELEARDARGRRVMPWQARG
jgi:hypothetical protein